MIGFDLSVLALFNNSPGTLFESARVSAAKAAFTTPVVAAPWNDPASGDESLQAKLAAVQRIKSFVSPTSSMGGKEIRDPDLLNSFTLYKALDRLLTLAKTAADKGISRSEEHTSELQSLMRISYAVFCLKKKTKT